MRLAWATPFNINSAIARFSREVCHELVHRGIDVEILRIEAPELETIEVLPTSMIIHPPSALLTDGFLRSFDAIVVNIGDYIQFHYRAIGLMAQIPAITIIHDSDLHHFVGGAVEMGLPIDQIAENLPAALRMFDGVDQKRNAQLAMFAAISCACVAHGGHYSATLKAACPGPVVELPLCYPDLGSIEPIPGPDNRLVVTTFGMINTNKQPDRVIRAIAASPTLRSRAIYRLVGPIEDQQRTRLTALAADLGLNPLEVHGKVTDEQLFELLAKSDVICCLRYPVTEGGSASLATALYSARPLIVPSFASYQAVPDEIAWKVSYGNDVEDLSAALQSINQDRSGAELRIKTMKAWALATYSAKAYIDKLLPTIEEAVAHLPIVEAGRSIGRTLETMTVALDDAVLKQLDLQFELFKG